MKTFITAVIAATLLFTGHSQAQTGSLCSYPAPTALNGTECAPVNQSGVTKTMTAAILAAYARNNGSTVLVNPPVNTTTQGVVVQQTTPTTGSVAGPVFENLINVVDGGYNVTGSGGNPFGYANAQAFGLSVQYSTQGIVSTGQLRGSLIGAMQETGPGLGSAFYGSSGSAVTNVANSGYLWGALGIVHVGATGNSQGIVGLEAEPAIFTGGVAAYRVGVSSTSQGPVAGTGMDAAFAVSNGVPEGAASKPFKTLMAISTDLYCGCAPLTTTADLFSADEALTIANVFNLPNMTLTGNFANFPMFGIKGSTGQAIFGGSLSLLGSDAILAIGNINATGAVTAGSGAADFVFISGGPSTGTVTTNTGSLTISSGGGATTIISDTAPTLPNITTGTNADFLCRSAGGVILLQTSSCTISSKRFKNMLPDYSGDALNILTGLPVGVFTMKDQENNPDHNATREQIGLYAEDIAKAEPRAAIYEGDGVTPKSYRQEAIIAMLVAADKQLNAKIDGVSHADSPTIELTNRLDHEQSEINWMRAWLALALVFVIFRQVRAS